MTIGAAEKAVWSETDNTQMIPSDTVNSHVLLDIFPLSSLIDFRQKAPREKPRPQLAAVTRVVGYNEQRKA
jgi:hypothetical protein